MTQMLPNASLQAFNTFGIASKCTFFSQCRTEDELKSILGKVSPNQLFILGGGSNILLPSYLQKWVVQYLANDVEVMKESDAYACIRVEAGYNWHAFVQYCLEKGWGGLENLSLIPGNIGAAPIQNIGAYGVEIEKFITQVNYIELKSLESKHLTHEECNFGYRNSIFKNELKGKVFITSIELKLPKLGTYSLETSYNAIQHYLKEHHLDEASIDAKKLSEIVIAIRQSKLPDPNEIGNSGSFFKNPIVDRAKFESLQEKYATVPHYPINSNEIKIPAGWLIDQAGWKGRREGQVGVHEKQALVIVNYGGASSDEIQAFYKKIQASILDIYGIRLEPEVNIIK